LLVSLKTNLTAVRPASAMGSNGSFRRAFDCSLRKTRADMVFMRVSMMRALNESFVVRVSLIAALSLAGACASDDEPDTELWPTKGWQVHTPEQEGMSSSVLEGTRAYAFAEGMNTQGVVVVRHGVIVAEWYAEGANERSWGASWSMAHHGVSSPASSGRSTPARERRCTH
jgi:hypothetical protein